MSGRCKCCNMIMSDGDMVRRYPLSRDFTELCIACLVVSSDVLFDTYVEPEESSDDFYQTRRMPKMQEEW